MVRASAIWPSGLFWYPKYEAQHPMTDWQVLLMEMVLAFAATALLLRPLISSLRKGAVLDVPNERSSHTTAVPKGAGIVILFVVVIGWCGQAWIAGNDPDLSQIAVVTSIAVVLGILSWIDDLKGLSALLRLVAHLAAAGLAIRFAPFQGLIFQGFLDTPMDTLFAVIIWVWFINLFNFMDGIDGISGVQSATVCLGVIIIGYLVPGLDVYAPYAAVLLGVSAGFLIWNWPPAKVFLGDVGSAPLGFLLGWMLLSLAASGQWVAALVLPGYYLADATITLIRRAVRGEKVWQAHREHFYQRAVASGLSHGRVTCAVMICGLLLVGIASVGAAGYPGFSVTAAIVVVLGLLHFLRTSGSHQA